MPKFKFALRSSHPEDIKEAILEFDDIMDSGIEHILGNYRINTIDRLRMSLSVFFGITLAQNVAPAAYYGSKIQTLYLQSKIL
jgi:hypothetical protein